MDNDIFHSLGEPGVEIFLKRYWQKKPLLIKNAFPDIKSPLSPDELAGLACEEGVNARLVLEKDGNYPWQVEYSPFEETRYQSLPETHWSLLISDIEKSLPETGELLKPFRFLPDWRLDDLMISYAPEGGSVGAHVDDYDVFLVQLSGQRLWQISSHFVNELLDDVDLRILKTFSAEQEWLCEAGDMLYLPPGFAHHGVAQNSQDTQGNPQHCMTASVGYRAPSLKTITSDFVNYLNEQVHDTTRYTDPNPVIPIHHAEISDDTVAQFTDYLKSGLSLEHEQIKRWLGQYCSDNKAFEEMIEIEGTRLTRDQQYNDFSAVVTLAEQSTIRQSAYSHFLFSYQRDAYSSDAALLFVDGKSYEVSKAYAEELCREAEIDIPALQNIMQPDDIANFLTLLNNGAIIIE